MGQCGLPGSGSGRRRKDRWAAALTSTQALTTPEPRGRGIILSQTSLHSGPPWKSPINRHHTHGGHDSARLYRGYSCTVVCDCVSSPNRTKAELAREEASEGGRGRQKDDRKVRTPLLSPPNGRKRLRNSVELSLECATDRTRTDVLWQMSFRQRWNAEWLPIELSETLLHCQSCQW